MRHLSGRRWSWGCSWGGRHRLSGRGCFTILGPVNRTRGGSQAWLGRRSQAVGLSQRCRERGNLPAWPVPPYFGAHRGVSRLAVLVGGGAGWGGGVAVQETRGRCLPAGAHCTRSSRDSGGAAFFGTPPPVPLLGQREGDPAGVGLCVRRRGFFCTTFSGVGLDDETAISSEYRQCRVQSTQSASMRSRLRGSTAPSASRCGVLLSLHFCAGGASGPHATSTDAG